MNHVGGGLTVGTKDAYVKLKAWPRIGVLVKQLRSASCVSFLDITPLTADAGDQRLGRCRQLLDAQLKRCIEEGTALDTTQVDSPIVQAVFTLLQKDGLSH